MYIAHTLKFANNVYSRVPEVFGSLARKYSVLVKLFIVLTRKDRIIRLS